MLFTMWQDTKPVLMLSTNAQANAEQCSIVGRSMDVPCPESVRIYNCFMGGVDRGDQLRGYYQVRLKSRKCYKYIFWYVFDSLQIFPCRRKTKNTEGLPNATG